MFRRIVTLGILGGLLLAAIAVGPAWAAGPTWAVSQVTTVNMAPYFAGVSGDRIVWQATAGSPRQLWTWKAGSAPLMLLEQYMWTPPQVSGDRVAWIATGGGEPFRVYTWKAGDTTVTVVDVSSTEIPDEMALSGDRLAWQVDYHSIVTWKVGDTQVTTLNVGPYQAANPRVDGERVVWEESNGSAWQIATWKAGGTSEWVTNDSLQHSYPLVSGDRIAWNGETPDAGTWAIYSKIATESAPATVAITGYLGVPACLSGDRVAWRQVPEGGSAYQVFTWKAGDSFPTQISHDPLSQAYVDLSGDRVAWTANTSVMTWKSGDATASVVATGQGPWDTRVSGDRIVWLNNGQVMTAVLRTATKLGTPTVSPTKPTHGQHAHFYAVLTPGGARTAAGATTTLKLYRKETHYVTKKVNGVNKRVKESYWHLRNTAPMKRYSSTSTSVKMTATVTPKYAGSWKAVVVYAGGSGFTGSTSPTKYFTVK